MRYLHNVVCRQYIISIQLLRYFLQKRYSVQHEEKRKQITGMEGAEV